MYGTLGSGLFEMLPQQMAPTMPLGSGMFIPQPVPLKKKFPLGSGMFDPGMPQGGPFPLGSGLYGQQMPMPNVQAGLAPGAQGQNNIQPQQTQQAAAAPAQKSFSDKLEGLLGNPAFLLGMNLLGGANSPNPWGAALQNTLAAQAQAARTKREQSAQMLDEKRFDRQMEVDERNYDLAQENTNLQYDELDVRRQQVKQQAALAEQAQKIAAMNAQTQARHADLGERRADMEEREFDYRVPFWDAQTSRFIAQTDAERQDLALRKRQFDAQQQWLKNVQGVMGGLFEQPQAVQPSAASAGGTAPATPPNVHTPVNWAQINSAYADGQPQRDSERTAILQEELAKETNPQMRVHLERELARQVGDQPPPAPQGNPQSSLKLAQAGVMASAAGLPGGSQLLDFAKMTQPQNKPAGGYTYDPVTGATTFNRDPYQEENLRRQAAGEKRAAAKDEREATAVKDEKIKGLEIQHQATKDTINSIDSILNNPSLDAATGLRGLLTRKVPGTPTFDVGTDVESLVAEKVLNTAKELKESGASLGINPTDRDAAIMEKAKQNLDMKQSTPKFRENLRELRDAIARTQARINAALEKQGVAPASSSGNGGTIESPEEYLARRKRLSGGQ